MKKITLLFLLLSVSLSFGQVVLDEDFEAGLTIPAGWTNNDIQGGGEVWAFATGGEAVGFNSPNTIYYSDAAMSGNYAIFDSDGYGGAIVENAALTSPSFDCTALTDVVLTFNHFFTAGFGGIGYVEVYDGTSWIEVASYTGASQTDSSFGAEGINVTTELAGVANAQVRFRWTGDFAWGWAFDDVIVRQITETAPEPVTTPVPADMATNVYVNPTGMAVMFDWTPSTTGDAATSYEIYLGDSATTLGLLGSTPNDMVNITGIEYSTVYYWQIVAKNVGGSAVGSSIWSFTTEADPNLSVDDETVNLFSVYPNPAKNQVSINTALTIESVEFYNQLGQNVLNVKGANMLNNSINVSSLNSGLYFMNISAEGRKQTIKVIKE